MHFKIKLDFIKVEKAHANSLPLGYAFWALFLSISTKKCFNGMLQSLLIMLNSLAGHLFLTGFFLMKK